jgi:hypothetical protein
MQWRGDVTAWPATGGVAIPEYVLSAILQWDVFWLRKRAKNVDLRHWRWFEDPWRDTSIFEDLNAGLVPNLAHNWSYFLVKSEKMPKFLEMHCFFNVFLYSSDLPTENFHFSQLGSHFCCFKTTTKHLNYFDG